MKYLAWPFRVVFTIYAVTTFVILMLFFFPIIVIASFWGKVRGGNFVYHLLRIWSAIWLPLTGIFHRNIYESKPDPQKQYIFLANHISYLDSAIIVEAIKQPFRPLGKMEMSKIPVFGFIYKVCVVMVDRSNAENRAKSIRQLKSVLKKGISILVFPEGTFNETDQPLAVFYDGAFRVAIETQTPIQPVLFLDTYSRMHYAHIFSLTPGKSRAVFLEPIPVEGLTQGDLKNLKEKVFQAMEKKLVAYQAAWIKQALRVEG
jgi:1-acyl-sn-glycerol-3-phosphate acyltransferase